MAKFPEAEPFEDVGSPSRSLSDRFPDDQLLRVYGFTVHARPHGREAIWRYRGRLLGHDEALRLVEVLRHGGEHIPH